MSQKMIELADYQSYFSHIPQANTAKNRIMYVFLVTLPTLPWTPYPKPFKGKCSTLPYTNDLWGKWDSFSLPWTPPTQNGLWGKCFGFVGNFPSTVPGSPIYSINNKNINPIFFLPNPFLQTVTRNTFWPNIRNIYTCNFFFQATHPSLHKNTGLHIIS